MVASLEIVSHMAIIVVGAATEIRACMAMIRIHDFVT
jgi:hypothetical protein